MNEIIFKKQTHLERIFFVPPKNLGDNPEKEVFRIEEGADAKLFFFYLYGRQNIVEKEFYIHENACVECHTIFFGDDSQIIKITEKFFILGKGVFARFFTRGLVSENAKGEYDGCIRVEKDAQMTDTKLDIRAFIFGKTAECRMVPMLEILANNVKAGHAATISKIQEDELFYLCSRGLNKAESLKLIIDGIFQSVFRKVSSQDAVSEVIEYLEKKYKTLVL